MPWTVSATSWHTEVRSRGLLAFRHYLNTCTGSDEFKAIAGDTQRLEADLSWVRYRLHIQGPRIRVNSYDPEPDYSAEAEQTFEKFKQGPVDGYRFEFPSAAQMNHVEAAILDREVQFYVACLEHVERFKSAGLAFCRSEVTSRSKDVFGREIFDLALANKLVREHAAVVASLGSSSRRRGAVSRQ